MGLHPPATSICRPKCFHVAQNPLVCVLTVTKDVQHTSTIWIILPFAPSSLRAPGLCFPEDSNAQQPRCCMLIRHEYQHALLLPWQP
jgi:hypothetical protein